MRDRLDELKAHQEDARRARAPAEQNTDTNAHLDARPPSQHTVHATTTATARQPHLPSHRPRRHRQTQPRPHPQNHELAP